MITHNSRCRTIIPAMVLLLLTGIGYAASGLPSHYPDSMPYVGTVASVDLEQRRIVIDDGEQYLARGIRVHSLDNSAIDLSAIEPGDRIGYDRQINNRRLVIWQIWQLPAGYVHDDTEQN